VSLDDQDGFPVGQRERLTVRLKSLIRQYQRGPGIIKEFIQNADDAGSDWVRVVMDWRDHRTGAPEEESLADVLGPALLIANGSVFTDGNFDAVQKIGESDKRLSAAKTGRFGLGFNTAYNVTDYPSLVSRERMYCFDPHEDAVARQGRAGLGVSLAGLKRQVPSWHGSFGASGLFADTIFHAGTIFRLPLRTRDRAARSEISHEPFDESAFAAIVTRLVADGPAMLLFTRNVLHLTIEEIPAEGGPARTLLDIRTENADEVAASRKTIHVPPDLDVADLLDQLEEEGVRSTAHRHRMNISTVAGPASGEWHVCQGFYSDPGGELLSHARKMLQFEERAIPEAGVAIALHRSNAGVLAASECEGLFCCGLPLPAKTGLPVHVNGCFDLDDSRTKPTSAGATSESGQARAGWNEALLTLAVAQAYADALEGLSEEVKDADPEAFYGLWPVTTRVTTDALGQAANAIHAALAERPIFRCLRTEGLKRVTLAELDVLPADAEQALVEALLAQDFCIPEPALPVLLTDGAEAAALEVNYVTPGSLRQTLTVEKHTDCKLEDAPFPALRKRDWLEAVARFILREKPVSLAGLPLCLLANGELAAFGHAKATGTWIATPVERRIFRNYLHWFIDEDFAVATGLEPEPAAKFWVMTPKTVLLNLNKPLPKVEGSTLVQWDPAGEKAPNEAWLIEVFDYFMNSGMQIARSEIEHFPLIPDQHGRLHKLYGVGTPLLPAEDARLTAALLKLGVPVLSGSTALTEAVRRFTGLLREEGIWVADGNDLIDSLAASHDSWKDLFPNYTPGVHGPILDVLSDQRCIEQLNDDRLAKLAGLRILPTGDGRVVDVKEPDFYLSAGEQPPPVSGTIHLARLGKREKWRPLLEAIGVKPLDLPTLIDGVLLPALPELEPERHLEVIEFIRTNFDRALQQEAAGGGTRTLKGRLGAAAIIQGTDGALHAAATLFSPNLKRIATVLGSSAVFPDLEIYPEPRDAWLDFFHAIGLKTRISAADIVARIDSLTSDAPTPHTRKQIGAVFEYLQKHWPELKPEHVPTSVPKIRESLANVLKRRKWLPAALTANFPGFTAPESRWFSPSELYPLPRGHLVAGEGPLLEGQSPTGEMLEALGLPQWPSFEVVLRRLDRLMALVAGTASGLKVDEIRKSFDDICRFLGRKANADAKARSLLVSRYAKRHCIWDHQRRRLIRPSDAFQDNVRFFEPHKVRIAPTDPAVAAGLDALGRRKAVEAADYRDFLDLLARHTGSSPCTSHEQDQALHALNELGRPDNADHVDEEMPVLTQTGRLLPLRDVLLRDSQVLAARVAEASVQFAHSGIAGRTVIAKLRRLSDAVTEVLAEDPMRSADAHMQALCRRLQDLIRSHEFSSAIRRLVSHELRYPVLDYEPPLGAVNVQPAVTIYTTLLLDGDDGERAVGGGEVDFFVERDAERIWIATRKLGSLQPKLARAINEILDPHRLQDTAPLVAILDGREPIETVLENYEIASLVSERHSTADWQDQSDHSGAQIDDPGQPDEENAEAPPAKSATGSHEGQEAASEPSTSSDPAAITDKNEEENFAAGGAGQRAAPSGTMANRGGSGSRPQSSAGSRQTRRSADTRGDHSSRSGSDEAPPIAPGTGRSREDYASTSPDRRETGGTTADTASSTSQQATGGRQRGRFYSYVSPPPDAGLEAQDGHGDVENASTDELEIGRAAVALVLTAERAAGRTPTEMSHTNPGYDVKSVGRSNNIRYIEVKGIDGPWGEAGVRLSATQFRFAMEKADAAWLYVVEYARDPGKSRIYRIQDAANAATYFCFDSGWQAIGAVEPGCIAPPVVGDEYATDDDGEIVTVVEVNAGESFTRLRVQFRDGSERFVVWKSRQPNATAAS
jgi:sacsin